MVSLYNKNCREYACVAGELVSYTSECVLTRGGGISGIKHIYDAYGRWIRDIP